MDLVKNKSNDLFLILSLNFILTLSCFNYIIKQNLFRGKYKWILKYV